MLGWIRADAATGALARALKDADPTVRSQAAWALGQIGTPEARTALAAALGSETNAATQEALTAALALADRSVTGRPSDVSAGEALLAAMSQIPASRWTLLLAMAVALAAALLWLGPRPGYLR